MRLRNRAMAVVVLAATSVRVDSAETRLATPAPMARPSYNVQYLDGHAGLPGKVKGTLVVLPDELQFLHKKKQTLFTLPVLAGTWTSQSERREKTFGRAALVVLTAPFWVILVGTFMGDPPSLSTSVHFVHVQSQTPSGVEQVTFQCAKRTCDAMVSRINAYAAAAPTPR